MNDIFGQISKVVDSFFFFDETLKQQKYPISLSCFLYCVHWGSKERKCDKRPILLMRDNLQQEQINKQIS